MKRNLVPAAAVAVLLLALPGHAQSVGVAARVGTLGLGGEASVDISRFLAVRGGFGAMPVHVNGTLTEVDYRVSPPGTIYNIGLDVFPLGGGLRLSGGLMFKRDDLTLRAIYTGSVTVNGQTYDSSYVGRLEGTLGHNTASPYATIGWGRTAGSGVGFFVDVGAAALGTPELALHVTGPAANDAAFQQNLETERQQAQQKIRKYTRVWPILSMGVRVGVR